jgi:hypothetical protein
MESTTKQEKKDRRAMPTVLGTLAARQTVPRAGDYFFFLGSGGILLGSIASAAPGVSTFAGPSMMEGFSSFGLQPAEKISNTEQKARPIERCFM